MQDPQAPWNVPTAVPALQYDLRPLSTGEVLDRTFSLYRSHFWLFAGIAAIPSAVNVLAGVGRIVFQAYHSAPPGTIPIATQPNPMNALQLGATNLAIVYATLFLYMLVYGVAKAATASAVTAVYLGSTTSIGTAYRSIGSRWYRWVAIAFWQIWSGIWLFMLLLIPAFALFFLPATRGNPTYMGLAGLLIFASMTAVLSQGLIAYIRNSLAIPAAVTEDLGIRAAMRRSKVLVKGRKGRIFLLLVLYFALAMVVGGVQTPLAFMIVKAHGPVQMVYQGVALLMGFVTSTLVAPITAIGLCLFYIDERVRREGFDIEFMMGNTFTPTAVASAVPALETTAEVPPQV